MDKKVFDRLAFYKGQTLYYKGERCKVVVVDFAGKIMLERWCKDLRCWRYVGNISYKEIDLTI